MSLSLGALVCLLGSGCASTTARVEVVPLEQTATAKEPLFLLRCHGGSRGAHYRWQLGSGLRAMPSVLDSPVLLVAENKRLPRDLEARCTLEREGMPAETAVGMVGKQTSPGRP